METEARPLPNAEMIEKSVLSAILQKPEELIDEFNELGMKSTDFYHPSNRQFYNLVCETLEKGGSFDLLQFTQSAIEIGLAQKMGGASFITEIFTYSPTTYHFKDHCKILLDRSLRRSLITKSADITAMAHDIGEDAADELADKAEKSILEAREGRESQTHTYTMRELVNRAVDRYKDAISNKDSDQFGIKTGFPTFDYMTGGLKKGNLYIIAARPSMGKTSIMANILEEIGMEQNIPCDFYSLEMDKDAVTDRMVAQNARINLQDLMSGTLTKSIMQSIKRSLTHYQSSPITVIDKSGMTASQIRSKTRRRCKTQGVKAVFVDYLQIMGAEDRAERTDDRVLCKNALKNMKEMAKECEVPVVVLAQLSRLADGVPAYKHNFSFLKDCGNIEQDADLILTIGHPEQEQDESQITVKRCLNILKQRNGAKGLININFTKEHTRFYE